MLFKSTESPFIKNIKARYIFSVTDSTYRLVLKFLAASAISFSLSILPSLKTSLIEVTITLLESVELTVKMSTRQRIQKVYLKPKSSADLAYSGSNLEHSNRRVETSVSLSSLSSLNT